MKKDSHFGMRVDKELHMKLKDIAEYEGRSLNGEIVFILRRYVAAFEAKHGEILVELENNDK